MSSQKDILIFNLLERCGVMWLHAAVVLGMRNTTAKSLRYAF